MVLGEDGIIAQAKLAAEKTKEAEEQSQGELANLLEEMNNILASDPPVPTKPTPTPKPTLKADGSFNSKKGVNSPKITAEMNPVYWDENGNEIEYYTDFTNKTVNESFEIDKWYDYVDTSVDGKENTSHWANVKTADGSYWVWIPRYAYRIISGYHTNSATGGEIDIKFLQGTEDTDGNNTNIVASLDTIAQSGDSGPSTVANQYVVHPAFQDGSATEYKNGEWNAKLTGIWVAKFEASPENANQTKTDSEYNGTGKNLQVKPGVASWRSITVSNMYTVCANYATNVLNNKNLNSHLMKNSEWGAVAYLAQSKYGRNKKEVGVNECSNYITGAGPKIGQDVTGGSYSYTSETFESQYGYKSSQGKKASTTGNVYGVYDMSGGAWECVAAYVDNSSSGLSNYEQSLTEAKKSAKWTVDVYKKGNSDTYSDNYSANNDKYGDAVCETSNNSKGTYSWFSDYSNFPHYGVLVFWRGGADDGSGAGLFGFTWDGGGSNSDSGFRPVLVITAT